MCQFFAEKRNGSGRTERQFNEMQSIFKVVNLRNLIVVSQCLSCS